jgi:hypothetical protein
MKSEYRAGSLYVLVHPSDPRLHKVGVTVIDPKKRLAQHNSQLDKAAGRIVQETGQKWELKTVIEVPDVYWAERAFWSVQPCVDFPFRRGVEVEWMMDWPQVEKGLAAAARAGVRPPQPPPRTAKSRAWVNAQLEGTGITLTARRYPGPGWVAEYQCAKGHVFTEYTKEVVTRKSCPCCVDWDWAEGYWGKGLRASLRELEHDSLRPNESRGRPFSIKSSASDTS